MGKKEIGEKLNKQMRKTFEVDKDKKNFGMFVCPDCGERLNYMFSNDTIWKEAQKEILKKIFENHLYDDKELRISIKDFTKIYETTGGN